MKLQFLTKEEALRDGAHLWILPSFAYSDWTRRLDWPLNLQITRAIHHVAPDLPSELKKILDDNEMDAGAKQTAAKTPLMIASHDLLPNQLTAVVDGDQWEAWINSSLKLWKDLLQPTLRIFLPTFANVEKLKSAWPAWADAAKVQFVPSETATQAGEFV